MNYKFIRLVVGDLDQKRAWRSRRKRANALPPDYRYTYKQIMKYSVNFGFPESFETDLLDFLSRAPRRAVRRGRWWAGTRPPSATNCWACTAAGGGRPPRP